MSGSRILTRVIKWLWQFLCEAGVVERPDSVISDPDNLCYIRDPIQIMDLLAQSAGFTDASSPQNLLNEKKDGQINFVFHLHNVRKKNPYIFEKSQDLPEETFRQFP